MDNLVFDAYYRQTHTGLSTVNKAKLSFVKQWAGKLDKKGKSRRVKETYTQLVDRGGYFLNIISSLGGVADLCLVSETMLRADLSLSRELSLRSTTPSYP